MQIFIIERISWVEDIYKKYAENSLGRSSFEKASITKGKEKNGVGRSGLLPLKTIMRLDKINLIKIGGTTNISISSYIIYIKKYV